MDRTDAVPLPRSTPQTRIPTLLLAAVAAALAFRVTTALLGPGRVEGAGRVAWQPRERAAALARAGGKPILYDFTAAWCGPCKMLDRDWDDASVADRVNAAFVPARIVDRQREDGKNPPDIDELQRRFEISGFPTLVAADADGKMIGKLEGYRGRKALEEFLSSPGSK
ncbi:MAG TPA: thioredoxin family protein [Thermoanaerobaculia bacterium]|jgi:thiol:disulfide interchange protein DsbD|nr:thioredoxin family protein [Thermoanaerobaculia bacterium]